MWSVLSLHAGVTCRCKVSHDVLFTMPQTPVSCYQLHKHVLVNGQTLVKPWSNISLSYPFLQVRTVSLTMGAPFLSHMATMSGTGLLIARHGPLLASAVLLPPGAAVLELLPYKWEWRDVSSLYRNMTQSTGRIHHWAWRPLDAKWCRCGALCS